MSFFSWLFGKPRLDNRVVKAAGQHQEAIDEKRTAIDRWAEILERYDRQERKEASDRLHRGDRGWPGG